MPNFFSGQVVEEEEPVMDYEDAMKEISVNDLGDGKQPLVNDP